MTMLKEKELNKLNERMLGLGAPVEIDNTGYNKVHYDFMLSLYNAPFLTVKQQIAMVKIFIRYSKTQLTDVADDLKETLKGLEEKADVKETPVVKVVAFDSESISLSWKFNRTISDYIKKSDRSNFRWSKDGNQWILKLYWDVADDYFEQFLINGFDISEITEAKSKLSEVELKDSNGNVVEIVYTAEIERPEDSIDTLSLRINYHPTIADTIKRLPFISYNATQKMYTFRIDEAPTLYKLLNDCKKTVDLSQLLPWKNLVDGWKKDYKMVDLSKFDLPFTPYPFQLVDINRMLKDKVVLNGNEMGTGKTFESVVTGESLPCKKLVICPATLRLNWEREIQMVNPKADINILYSDKDFKVAKDWTIIGYPSVAKFQKELEKENFQCIFIDEAHYCQAIGSGGNPESIRAKAVLRLTATAGRVYPLTGTPKPTRNKNLFNILRMIRHELAKGQWSFMNYGKEYCDGVRGSWGWDFEGNSNDGKLNSELTPKMIRHLKSEVLPDLKKQRMVVPVQVDLTEYHEAIAEYLANRKSKEAEQLARLMRAKKILATQKVGETIDFAKEIVDQNEKVVIVTCFTDVVKVVEKAFSGNVVKIVGGMSDSQKNEAVQEFQNGTTQVLVMNIIAGGVGITLTASHNIIFNDYDWTVGNVIQAEDRICRGGQTKCCMVHFITAKGADVEEEFVDMLTYKSETINEAIDGGNGDVVDFRHLVDKSAGFTRSDKVRQILSEDKIKAPKTTNSQPKTEAKKTESHKSNFSGKTLEELEAQILKLGGTPKKYDSDKITRMRMIMLLKKLQA